MVLIFIRRRSLEFLIFVASPIGSSGGLKGKMASGDAHPYLTLFYLENFALLDLWHV